MLALYQIHGGVDIESVKLYRSFCFSGFVRFGHVTIRHVR